MEPNINTEQSKQTDSEASTTEHTTAPEVGTVSGVEQYRTFAILGYILPFLFFLPLLDDKTKNVPYVRFHANQQLVLLVVVVAASILHNFLFVMLMSLGYMVYQVLNLVILALAVFGAYNAYHDRMKPLPFVGQFQILK